MKKLFAALLLLALGLTGCSGGDTPDELWIIGLDGADWDILDPMIAAGELPNLAALRSEGASGVLRSDEPMLSPIVWTSIATGKTADLHGVTWFMTDGPNGEKIPISSRNRHVRALWDIVSQAQQEVGIIGWWATWPVDPVQGFIVSDYVGWHSFGVTGRQLEVPGKVWPTDWQSWVLAALPNPDQVQDSLLQTMVHLPPERLGFDASRGPFGGPIPHLRQAVATARGYTDIALEALRRDRPRLFAVYYEGTDAIEHLFGQYMPPKQEWVEPQDFEAFRDAVRGYWQYQDRLVGELVAQRGPGTTILVISDHGFRQGSERLQEEQFDIDRADASHMKDGILIANGPGITAGTRLRGATIYDITPTALAILGLPAAKDMYGRVLEEVAPNALSPVDTYEVGDWDRGDNLVVDPESGRQMEEMLRSLGYISGGSEAGSGEEVGTDGDEMTVEHAVNLAVVYKRQAKFAEAIEVLQKVLAEHPTSYEVRQNLAQMHAASGDFERAVPLYAKLLEEYPENLELIQDYGVTLGHAGRNVEAVEVFRAGTEVDPNWAEGWASLGFAWFQSGRRDDAVRAVEKSLELDDRVAISHYYRGILDSDAGDLDSARVQFERALQLDPSLEDVLLDLVDVDRNQTRYDAAIGRLLDFEDRNGATRRVEAALGSVYLESGQNSEALAVLSGSSEQYPDDAGILSNLGVAQVLTNDLEGARRSFEKLLVLEPDVAESHVRMGKLLAQIGNTTAAMRELKRALEIDPDDPTAAFALATIYHQQNRLADAIPLYEQVVAEDPDNALAIYQLAMAVGASGGETRARQLLQRARELDPSLPMPGRQ